ncbi:MAG: ABC transporter ATP-binding protein [Gammaproteobacteria bacterium]|nr:ABC transporter ATP-binding protein [Gammaproteobacteria bacterium]
MSISKTASPLVQLESVKFGWPGREAVIDFQQLEIVAGEHCFIQGPSGSGKSTLLNLIGGVLLPQSGSIQVLDQDIASLRAAQRDLFRADHIGFIFQQFNLIPYLSILENVMLPCRFSAKRRDQSIQRSGSVESEAHYLLSHLYGNSGPELSQNVAELSVGQQQRVAAARALMGQPELIIADEPTSSLDIENREAFMNLLFDEVRQAQSTLLFVSHDPAYKQQFNRCIDLDTLNQSVRGRR